MIHCTRAAALIALAMLTGCEGASVFSMLGSGMSIESTALESDARVTGNFTTAVYNFEDPNTLDVILIDGSVDDPHQAVHIQMYWRPRAGLTPLDDSATNAVVRYAIFDGEQVALYGGGGMLRPGNKPGGKTFRASLLNATMRLMDADESATGPVGFIALAEGGFTATRNDLRTTELVRAIQMKLKEKLGYPRFIGQADPDAPLAMR